MCVWGAVAPGPGLKGVTLSAGLLIGMETSRTGPGKDTSLSGADEKKQTHSIIASLLKVQVATGREQSEVREREPADTGMGRGTGKEESLWSTGVD